MKKQNKKTRSQKLNMRKKAYPKSVVIIFAILVAVASFFLLKPLMTGYVVISENQNYVDSVNQLFDSNMNYTWSPEHHGELMSLRVSGSIIGNGSVKIYLEQDNKTYILLDSNELLNKKSSSITGLVVGVNTTSNQQEGQIVETNYPNPELIITENLSEQNLTSSPLSNEDINGSLSEQNLSLVGSSNLTEEQNASEPPIVSTEKAIMISLVYNAGTEYNIQNNGLEKKNGIIDFTVNDSTFTWDADYSKVCTKWEIYSMENSESTIVCSGSQECCNLIQLQPISQKWNDPFYLYYGRYGATDNNIVSAQVIYVNYTLNSSEPTAEIYSSNLSSLNATFIEQLSFNEVCGETCILYGFNESSYNLVLEVENGTVVHLDNISYRINTQRILDLTPPNPVTNVTVNVNESGLLIQWKNPPDSDFAGVRILRKEGFDPNANFSKAILDENVTDVSYLVTSKNEFALDKGVTYNHVYFYRVYAYDIYMNYAPGPGAYRRYIDISVNHAPEFVKNISDIVIYKNAKKVIDLSEHFVDIDGDILHYDSFKVNNIAINIDGNVTTFIPSQNYTGKQYTYFTANDSSLIAISNLVTLNVIDAGLIYRENTTQIHAQLNTPGEWTQTLYALNMEPENKTYNIEINLPEYSQIISVYDVKTEKMIDNSSLFFKLNDTTNETNLRLNETSGMPSYNLFFEDALNAGEEKEYSIMYQTPPPSVQEEILSNYIKRITISSNISYTNILAYTDVNPEKSSDSIKLYHVVNNTLELVNNATYLDTNNNSLIDRVEWIVPHLSEQVYLLETNSLNLETAEVGNNAWRIQFVTTGVANLTIGGINTTFAEMSNDNITTLDNLMLDSLQCNDTVLFNRTYLNDPHVYFVLENNSVIPGYESINNSFRIQEMVYANYSCDSIGYFSMSLLSAQKRSLSISFGEFIQEINYSEGIVIPVTQLYFKDTCPPCLYNASPDVPEFCPISNSWQGYVSEGYPTYTSYSELEFNVSSINKEIQYAEMCGYVYTILNRSTSAFDYIQSIESIEFSYAKSDMRPNNSMFSANVARLNMWSCIPVSDILKNAVQKNQSMMYVRWLGEDNYGSFTNYVCFKGPGESLNNCGGYNPSGALDCRPYLNVIY